MDTKPALNRDHWIQAGRKALEDGGVEAVRVEVLAKDLGVSKGSFYWHFKNRQDLLEALLERWEDVTDWLIETSNVEKTPHARFRKLFTLIQDLLSQGERSPDPAIFAWSQQDKNVAKRVARVESKRLAFLKRIFLDAGFKPSQAVRRSEVGYLIFCGYLERTSRQAPLTSDLDDLTHFMIQALFKN
jgi:AcrR family transcriptional regulator